MSATYLKMLLAILGSITGTFELINYGAAYNADAGAYIGYQRNKEHSVNVVFYLCDADRSGDNSFEFRCVMNTVDNENDARQFISEFIAEFNGRSQSRKQY